MAPAAELGKLFLGKNKIECVENVFPKKLKVLMQSNRLTYQNPVAAVSLTAMERTTPSQILRPTR